MKESALAHRWGEMQKRVILVCKRYLGVGERERGGTGEEGLPRLETRETSFVECIYYPRVGIAWSDAASNSREKDEKEEINNSLLSSFASSVTLAAR